MARTLSLFIAVTALLAVLAAPSAAPAQDLDSVCAAASPLGLPCVGLGKIGEAANAECRRLGLPESACVLPIGHAVLSSARDAYLKSWLHRAAQLQYALGDSVPFGRAQWLGTHNSFNSVNDTITVSHTDSNQQLSLTQQLDVDIRAIEIDIHFINGVPTVCHGQGPDSFDAGCTNEPPLSAVLPAIAAWLNKPEHRDQVILLYVEDELKKDVAFPPTVAQFDSKLRRADGSSLIYHPDRSKAAANGCVTMPHDISRDDVRKAGAQIVMVGNCAKGWASDVYNWNPNEVESGSTEAYKPFPVCDHSYARSVYDTKFIRYFEDSTFVSAVTDPLGPAVNPGRLTPDKAAAMTACGVNLFGFDQLLPDDGRIAATIFSWAPGQPDAAGGGCAAQRADGRWVTRQCARLRRAACRTASAWRTTTKKVTFRRAAAACRAIGARFAVPRTGYENSRLRQAAAGHGAWLDYAPPKAAVTAAHRPSTHA
jgi:hypothetical protein